jgi:hypothetical protein
MSLNTSGKSNDMKEMINNMAKRKAQHNAAEKNNKTPLKNKQETEFASEYTHGEDASKGKNRNSAKGMKGRS